jgi:hypothetical protein
MPDIPYLALALATLIYLLVDIYPSIKSFEAMGKTGSFWLLWLVFVVLNLIAWGALEVAVGLKAKEWVGRPELAALLLVVLATLGTVTMLQSFTLKAADVKVIDVGPLVENFRQAVLASAAANMAVLRKREERQLASKLAAKFAGNAVALRTHYHTAFSFGGNTTAQIGDQLAQLQTAALAAGLPFEQLLAVDIVKADIELARSLV